MEENNESDPSISSFTHCDPLFDSEQLSRYQRIKQTNNQLQKLDKLLENYLNVGRKFSQAVLDLHEGIQNIDNVAINNVYTKLNNSLLIVNKLLNCHLNQVESNIHVQMRSFMKHDMNSMKQAKAEYFAINSKYTDFNDKYISTPKKNIPSQPADRLQKVIELHRQSSHSFYDYVMQLDVTESRYNNLIGTLLITYIKSWCGEDEFNLANLAEKNQADIEIVTNGIAKSNEDIAQKMLKSQDQLKCVDSKIDEFYHNMDLPYTGQPDSDIQGYLWKKSGHFSVTWDKLFFMCKDGFLAASNTPGTCARPLWTMQLLFCDIKPSDTEDRPNCFTIIAKDKSIILQAPSLHLRDKWVATLNSQKEEQFHSGPTSPTTDAHFQPFKEEPEKYCADCGAPKADWYIINKGEIVCDQCAGIHRGFPPSISKVRSSSMDANNIFITEIQNELGNDFVNSILEAHDVTDKINPSSTREERLVFLRKKYIEKQFISRESVDLVTALKQHDVKGVFHCILDESIMQPLGDGLNALHAAAIIGHPLIVSLIAMNCPLLLNTLDDGRWTPLNYAVYYNNLYCVDALLACGCDPNVQGVAVPPYAIASTKQYDAIASRVSAYRPETYEIVKDSPPSSLFEPANDLDLTVYDENEQKMLIEKNQNAQNSFPYGIRRANSGAIPHPAKRRMTIGPRSVDRPLF